VTGCCELGNEHSGSIKGSVDYLNDYLLRKRDSAPWS
jgi:hypothetical protein